MTEDQTKDELLTVDTPAGDGVLTREEIPLPPRDMWVDLDNTPGGAAAPERAAAPAAPKPVRALAFLDRESLRTVTLAFPFVLDDLGEVRIVSIRRLTGADLVPFSDLVQQSSADNVDFAAYCCGLPADVLRGMDAGDALKVVRGALDFLPPAFQEAIGWGSPPPTSGGSAG